MAQFMFRSSVTQMFSLGMPRSNAASATYRIMISGPQVISSVDLGRGNDSRSTSRVTTPTLPIHESDVTINRRLHAESLLGPGRVMLAVE